MRNEERSQDHQDRKANQNVNDRDCVFVHMLTQGYVVHTS